MYLHSWNARFLIWIVVLSCVNVDTFLHRQLRELRSSSVTGRGSGRGSAGSLSPLLSSTGSPRAPNHSPAGLKRRPASFHARTPRTPRPNDLKVTPISRMLNTPTSVDSLPRLRRFSSSQTQHSSFAYLGHDEGVRETNNRDPKDNKEKTEEVGVKMSGEGVAKEKEETQQEKRTEFKEETSEVLCQPVSELRGAQGDPQDRSDLVEVSLSRLTLSGDQDQEITRNGEKGGEDQKLCCGFFFKVSF